MPELPHLAAVPEPVPTNAFRLYSRPAWLRLARHQQQLLHIPNVPIAATLWISADAQWTAQHAPSPLLTRLHPDSGQLSGDLVCEPSQLPFERDSLQTIVVQHAADAMADLAPMLGELCRVLEPGGQLFWFGLNPLSAWASWSHWHEGPTPSLHPRWMREVDRLLMRHGVDAIDSRYLGGLWPRSQIANEARRVGVLDGLRGVWMLAARKRRAVLTPIRLTVRAPRPRPMLTAIPSSRMRQ